MSKFSTAAFAALLVFSMASAAPCADLSGTVTEVDAKPVKGIQILVAESGAKSALKVVTDDKGDYRLTGLSAGTYTFALDPGSTGFRGGTAIAYLGDKGLTVNWRISRGGPPSAIASQGSNQSLLAMDPLGMTLGEFAGIVAGGAVVAGGVAVGAYSAAGGFSGAKPTPSPRPISPSM